EQQHRDAGRQRLSGRGLNAVGRSTCVLGERRRVAQALRRGRALGGRGALQPPGRRAPIGWLAAIARRTSAASKELTPCVASPASGPPITRNPTRASPRWCARCTIAGPTPTAS